MIPPAAAAKPDAPVIYAVNSSADYERIAPTQNLVIDYPRDNELQIDIDSAAERARFDRAWQCFCRNFGTTARDLLVTPSKSGGEKQHIRVFLPFNVEPVERIAMQAALGSDGVRELLSLRRIQEDDPHPTLFAETPEMMKTIRRDNGDELPF